MLQFIYKNQPNGSIKLSVNILHPFLQFIYIRMDNYWADVARKDQTRGKWIMQSFMVIIRLLVQPLKAKAELSIYFNFICVWSVPLEGARSGVFVLE